MSNIRTILVPVDFSACSEDAFPLARALARDYQARVIVLHIATPPVSITPRELEAAFELPHGYRAQLEDRLRLIYEAKALPGIEYRIEIGDPAAEILRLAKEVECDLIVMGTHGRTGFGRILLGSVAESVIRHAVCPVVTVRSRPGKVWPAEESETGRIAGSQGVEAAHAR